MTTIASVSAKLTNNLNAILEDLTEVGTAAGAAALQYDLLTASKQDATIGSDVNGLNIVGSAGKRFNSDGTVKASGIATFSDSLGTFGSLTGTTDGALLTKTVTGATADASDAAFRETFGSVLSERQMFEASLAAGEALADSSALPLGASTTSLITDAAVLLRERSDRMLRRARFQNSILEDITGTSNLATNTTVPKVVRDAAGIPSVPLIDFANIDSRTLLQTFEEMEAYLRSSIRKYTEIVIHATGTTKDVLINYDTLKAEAVAENQNEVRFHLLILSDGTLQVARPIAQVGNHSLSNRNQHSLGVALVGGRLGNKNSTEERYSSQAFTLEQYNTLNALLKAFYTVVPGGQVWGQNNIDPTVSADPYFDVTLYVEKKFNKFNIQTATQARDDGALSINELIEAQI